MLPSPEVLQYTGGDNDRGGVISVVRNLASTGHFRCVLGVNPGCVQHREPALEVLELPRIAGEEISPLTFWRARVVALVVQTWLQAGSNRVYHGHSRAGLLVGLWLHWLGERRAVVSVHCYGRHRWFYRWAADRLGSRLYWLSPAMKKYYSAGDPNWTHCMPECVPPVVSAGLSRTRVSDLIRLGGIGALVRWKNWQLVLDALALLPAEIRQRFRFRHIGTDDGSADSLALATELRTRSETAGLRGIVEWHGQQASPEFFLSETDCLVVASNNEPFSVAMLEALRAGVPVLAADSGGAQDIVRPGSNGWLFRTGDAAGLARQLELLVNSDALDSLRVGQTDLRQFDATIVAERWAKIYFDLGAV